MARADKLLERMRNNAAGDYALANLQTVARRFDIDWVHEGSSHCIFRTKRGVMLSVPARRPIKPVYIKLFVNLVDEI